MGKHDGHPMERTYLIVSDMHFSTRSGEDEVDRFCAFLDWLEGGRGDAGEDPPTLVVAGDFLNLDIIDYREEPGSRLKSDANLERIMRRFPRLASSLAAFLARGGRLVLMAGNHDAELFDPAAARMLKNILAGRLPEGKKGAIEGLDLGSPARFLPGGNVHIEHGNRFDGDNAFERVSLPSVQRGELPLLPLGSLITRDLLSRIPELNWDGFFNKTPLPLFLTILRRHGVLGGLFIVWCYHRTAFTLMRESFRRKHDRGLRAVDGAIPTLHSPMRTMRRLYLDRSLPFAFFCFWLCAFPLVHCFAGLDIFLWGAAAFLAVILAGLMEGNRYRETMFQACRRGAEGIAAGGKARTVILGHTHVAETTGMNGGSDLYLNSGSFTQPVEEKGSPYVRLRLDGGVLREAELMFFEEVGLKSGDPKPNR